jgi:hypothetical protein
VAARISLRREHVVAASLVGSVVVVLGFASGLGIHHTTGAAAAPPATTGTPAPPPATDTGSEPGSGGYQPVGYPGVGGQQGDNPYVATPTASMPTVTAVPTATTTTGPVTTTPGTTTTTTGPTCTPGLVPQVVGTLTTGVQGLPLLGPVVAGVGLPPLVDTLLGSCPATTTTTPTPTPR